MAHYRCFLFWMMVFLSFGCVKETLDIKVRFQQIEGLKEGDPVLFEDNIVGAVTRVFYSPEGSYVVDLSISEDFKNAATEHSQFFITSAPGSSSQKAIEIVAAKSGGLGLKDGAVVEGSTKASTVIKGFEKDLEQGIEDARKGIEDFLENLKGVAGSEELKSLEKELEGLIEDMMRTSKVARDKVEKEILPQFKQEVENLRKRLQELGKEKGADPSDTRKKETTEL